MRIRVDAATRDVVSVHGGDGLPAGLADLADLLTILREARPEAPRSVRAIAAPRAPSGGRPGASRGGRAVTAGALRERGGQLCEPTFSWPGAARCCARNASRLQY